VKEVWAASERVCDSHYGKRVRLLDGNTKGFEVDFSQGTVANDDVRRMLPVLLLVADLVPSNGVSLCLAPLSA
jgi:hypothetical protein